MDFFCVSTKIHQIFLCFWEIQKFPPKIASPRFEPICRFVAFLVVFVHGSVALGPPPPLFAFPSLNFANFPRIWEFLGSNFRPKSKVNHQKSGRPVLPGSGRYDRVFKIWPNFFLFPRFVLAFPLWFESFLVCLRLRHLQASAATRHQRQVSSLVGCDIY